MDDETQAVAPAVPVQTDTATEETKSEVDVQVNNEAPEAAPAPKEADVNATDTAEEKLYAGKYKSPEDMEKAYKELESKFGRETSEKAELTRILNEAFATPEPATAATDTDSYEYQEPTINSETEGLKRDTAVLKFIIGHQDADGGVMKEILATDPLINQIQGHEAKLEYAYLRSQSMGQKKAIETATKTAQVQAQAKVVEKQAAQVETAQKAVPVDEDAELMATAVGGNPTDSKAARQAIIRKRLINL